MNSHRTAISRVGLSRPAKQFDPYLVGRCLDFGCGKGQDADILGAVKYDPHYFPDRPEGVFDHVLMIYVLNTVEYPRPVLEDAWNYLKPGGNIYIAARTVADVRRNAQRSGWTPHGRGWVTKRKTFQRGLCAEELVKLLPADSRCVESGNAPFSWIIARRL